MTREEAVERLKRLKRSCRDLAASMPEEPGWALHGMALDMALSALHPVSREQVEKVWRGEWDSNGPRDIVVYCKQCMMPQDIDTNFCHSCGAAMTDEAVEMVMRRLEALHETT